MLAILRLSVTGGVHLEFSHEKVDEKIETVFIQSFGVNVCRKTKLLKIYIKNHRTYICYIIAYTIYILQSL